MTEPAGEYAVRLSGHAVGIFGQTQNLQFGDDFVEVIPVPPADLAVCAEDRFVAPGGQWADAARKLGTFGTLILTGDPGTGRRTAALRLLQEIGRGDPVWELVPSWKKPAIHLLPAPPPSLCLLNMSEPDAEHPGTEFGKRLVDWARDNDACLVVIADETGAGRWTDSAGNAVARLRSPDARALAERELHAAGAHGQLAVLDAPELAAIWKSSPKAEDARRLAHLVIHGADRSPQDIVNEYRGWRKWIDSNLPEDDLGGRTLMWSAAFCDGGQRRSVLRMSEDLRERLDDHRGPKDILKDKPSSKRLKDAHIEPDGDLAWLAPECHGLADALRTYLWDEFNDEALREILTGWIVSQLGSLPPADADRVADSVLDIALRFRDDDLLRALRDELTGSKQPIAVRTLTRAALDPKSGARVRASLLTWARSPGPSADLVAEICGGEFGERQPTMALVRLRRVAQSSPAGGEALSGALTSLASRRPDDVLGSIGKWFTGPDPTAGINGFLALASTQTGAALLCGRADPDHGQPGFRDDLISYFQRSLEHPSSYDAAMTVLEKWEQFSAAGAISSHTAIGVLGKALRPVLEKNPLNRLQPGFDMDSFWGQAFGTALRDDADQPAAPPNDPLTAPGATAAAEADASAPAGTCARSLKMRMKASFAVSMCGRE